MVIVTGANGFIGSNLIQYLNSNGINDVIAVDTTKSRNNEYKFKMVRFLTINEFLSQCLSYISFHTSPDFSKNIDAVFHLGAIVDTASDHTDILHYNYTFSQILTHFCNTCNIPLLYASSAAVYGNSRKFNENQKDLTPLNLYAKSKYLFDNYLQNEFVSNNLNYYGFRFFNVYGPNELHKGNMASAVTQIYAKARVDNNITLFKSIDTNIKDGDQSRDFVHVDNIVKTMFNFFNAKNSIPNGIYNVGTGESISFTTIATYAKEVIEKHFRTPILINFIETPEELKKSYQSYTRADMTKTREIFNDKPNAYAELKEYYEYLNTHVSSAQLKQFLDKIQWK